MESYGCHVAGSREVTDGSSAMTGGRKHDEPAAPDNGQTEADRQGVVQVWPRAFGVSSDDLGGAAEDGEPRKAESDTESDRQRE